MTPTILAFDKEQTKYALQHYEGEGGERRGTNSIREQLLPRIPPWGRVLTHTDSQEDGVRTAIGQIYTYLPRAGRDRKSIPK